MSATVTALLAIAFRVHPTICTRPKNVSPGIPPVEGIPPADGIATHEFVWGARQSLRRRGRSGTAWRGVNTLRSFAQMEQEAQSLGKQLVEAALALDQVFGTGRI